MGSFENYLSLCIVLLISSVSCQTNSTYITTTPSPNITVPVLTNAIPLSAGAFSRPTIQFSGTNLNQTVVRIGSTRCASISYISDSSLSCVADFGLGKNLSISVNSAISSNLTFNYFEPFARSISPSFGPASTSPVVTIFGNYFGINGTANYSIRVETILGGLLVKSDNISSGDSRFFVNETSIVYTSPNLANVGVATFNLYFGPSIGGTALNATSVTYTVVQSTRILRLQVPGDVSTFNQTFFRTEMARICKVPDPAQVYIISVSSGSVIVDFRLLVNPSDTQSSAITTLENSIKNAASDGSLFNSFGATGLTIGGEQISIAATSNPFPGWGIAIIVVGIILVASVGIFAAIRVRDKKRRIAKRKAHIPYTGTQMAIADKLAVA